MCVEWVLRPRNQKIEWVRATMWVLRTKLRSSEEAISALIIAEPSV